MSSSSKTIAFFGASTGVGLSALKHTLAAGHHCIALCRNPSKLTAIFPPSTTPNLKLVQGNARDVAAVSKCLVADNGKLVDEIISTLGSALTSTMGMEQPDICAKGMETLLAALTQLRRDGATGRPHIVSVGTTGMSRFGRDVPLLMIPVYATLVKNPIKDKKISEGLLVDSGESYTIVHASMLTDGETNKKIRVGIEDPKKGRESMAIGYNISREDVGKWIADHLVLQLEGNYVQKIVVVTN